MEMANAPMAMEYAPGSLDQPGFFDGNRQSLPFFFARIVDEGCTAMLDTLSVGPRALEEEGRSSFTASCRLEVLHPARPDEAIVLGMAVTRIGTKSFGYRIAAFRKSDGVMLGDSHHVAVVMDMNGEPATMPVPDNVRSLMESMMLTD